MSNFKRKKKIVFITTGLGAGGAENQVCGLADELCGRGYLVTIISLVGEPIIFPSNSNVLVVNIRMRKTLPSIFGAVRRVRSEIKNINPDVVHAHMVHSNIFSRFLRLFCKMNILINTAHSINEGGYFTSLIYKRTDFLCDIMTNVSQAAVNEYIKKGISPNGKIIYIPNGIDFDKFKFSAFERNNIRRELQLSSKDIMFLSVGRLTEAKDYPNLINAILLSEKLMSSKFFIAGAGPDRDYINDLILKNNLSETITLLGFRDDIRSIMCACDIFVLSSEWEGLPLVLGEAMSLERLVVSTKAGGASEIVGNAGLLVDVKCPEQLSDALKYMLNLPENEKHILGTKAREKIISNYSIKAVVDRWLSVYENRC